MKTREFTAVIVADFKNKWLEIAALNIDASVETALAKYGGKNLDDLHERISGKRCIIVENEYPLGSQDWFEKLDNDFVIHPSLFTEISADE